MKRIRKLIAMVTSASLLSSFIAITSCSGRSDELVPSDAPWYSLTKLETCNRYSEGEDINFYATAFAGSDNDMFYYVSSGQYNPEDGADYANIDFTELTFMNLDIYDINGDLYKTIDLNSDIDLSSVIPDGSSAMYGFQGIDRDHMRIEDGKLIFLTDIKILPDNEDRYYYVTYDIESETVEDMKLILTDDPSDIENNILVSYSPGRSYRFDGYLIDTFTTHSVDHPPKIRVENSSGEAIEYDIGSILPDLLTSEVSEIIYLGDDQALVGFLNGNRIDKEYYTLDLLSGSFTPYNEDTSWFSNYFTYCEASYIEGTGYVITDNTGIKKLDFDNKTVDEIFSYDNCNINRYDTRYLSIVSIEENRIVLSGAIHMTDSAGYDVLSQRIYMLDKQETNPHVGKKIITAATLTDFDYTFCEAVVDYNDRSSDYFIKLDSQYSMVEMYLNGDIRYYYDGFATDGLESQSQISSRLAIDLMSGEGPDLIIDGASYLQLYNSEYLMDLSSEIDTSSLFTNVIESTKTDGKIYQLPLTVGINGIVANTSDISSGQFGFTFEQYSSFVSGPCNGEDPIGLSQTEYFITCLSYLNGECIIDDNVDYGTNNFISLAAYVKDNVFDPVMTSDNEADYYSVFGSIDLNGGSYVNDISFADFIKDYYNEDIEHLTILGIPSGDGRGPMLTVSSSVAVSAKTDNKEACIEFIRSLLSDEVQKDYGMLTGSIPVNVNAFETSAQEILSEINIEIERSLAYASAYGYTDPTMPSSDIDSSVIDNFEEVIDSCSQVATLDPEIMIIVKEEMPAYFTDQKSIEEVISIINDRVTVFINERS